ncbi:cytochrome BD ubiquinol oxidase subunit II [Meridianimarinicoccus roseus]|jgi:cytochrome d ubiquinol oxidase subunit II|uniref:Cytochrome BD ubiquinol oxidase subunit II n=1 Tax=Meridianimarinicoccus roseus TaxID=2072018 RepID=A0A2V2LQ05_9RHOB|nr:cytochrome d ubiquinol oxidase subunit II [Meridianimarinicoccus roseus]PWR03653.1 cytochrome BD ubiquinol oxidase subunit II [Meridianimarinicoccus roseus]
MNMFGDPAIWLPLAFAGLMGLSILIYVVLDGFDLGVGLLFPFATEAEKDRMVGSIGPFWDANETWLVLAVGLLLVAFPQAHGAILGTLYLPVAVMLIGLILRGVAFEFRAKAPAPRKVMWNHAFFAGSFLTAFSQGVMLGLYIMGLQITAATLAFSVLTGVFLTVAYSFIAAVWLIGKAEGDLQRKAVGWARGGLWGAGLGMAAVSAASPMVSARIWDKWFNWPEVILLAPLPLGSVALVIGLWRLLGRLPAPQDRWCWLPFTGAVGLFVLAFGGLAYSFYPYVVPERLTVFEAAAAPESLFIILIGALVVLPVIIAYSVLAYTVFRGKATDLRYD